MSVALAVQMKGFGLLVVMIDVVFDGRDQFLGTLWKTPRRMRFRARSRKKRSTMFSHEALVGVKCMWKRRMARQPALHVGMFVGGVVVADEVELLFRGCAGIDARAESFSHSLMRVTLHAHGRSRLTVERVERGKQRGRAVALVIVGHGLRRPFLGQSGLRAVQRLNLALLIEAQSTSACSGGFRYKSDDILQLLRKMQGR